MDVKSIDDTSNFDEFPDVDLKWRKYQPFITIVVPSWPMVDLVSDIWDLKKQTILMCIVIKLLLSFILTIMFH